MSDINISSIGAGTPAGGVGKVEDEAKTKKAEKNDDAKKNVKQATDENEQVELQCADEDDGNAGVINDFAKKAVKTIKSAWNKLTGKGGWKDIQERKQELQQQKNEQMQQLMDISQKRQTLMKEQELEAQKALIEEQINELDKALNKPIEPSPTILPSDNIIDPTPTVLPSDVEE